MQGESEEFPEFSEMSQKGNASSGSDRDMEDSDSREAIASSLARKEKGEGSVSKEEPSEELELKEQGPVASRTRFHSTDRAPKPPTTPTRGKRGTGKRKLPAPRPQEEDEEEENVECASCARARGQWVNFKKTRDVRFIHSVLKHWLLLLVTMHLVWKQDAKLTPSELPDLYMYTWHEFKGLALRRKKEKLSFYIFVKENEMNPVWNVLVS